MKNTKVILPHYTQWALTLETTDEIAEALANAFNQGYHLGLNNGWAIEQDKEIQAQEDYALYSKLPNKPIC